MTFQQQTGKPQFHALRDKYQRIRSCKLLVDKTLERENIEEFQQLLNEAQPPADQSEQRSMIQFLYRKHPSNFCQFLARSNLNSYILWTEAKSIVMHFGLRGVVYVKWDTDKYVCSLHKNVLNSDDSPKKSYEGIGRSDIYKGDNRPDANRNERRGDHRGHARRNRTERYYDRVSQERAPHSYPELPRQQTTTPEPTSNQPFAISYKNALCVDDVSEQSVELQVPTALLD